MIVTFCGHSQYRGTGEDEQTVMALLTEIIGDHSAELYLGGYGSFDAFARKCSKIYQKTHPNVKVILVTPYLTPKNDQNEIEKQYDAILYPPLEQVPPRLAILRRNKWMAEQADAVIAYIDHSWGGAYQFYLHAKRKKRRIYNLAEKEL